MRSLADRLQGAAPEPPRSVALGSGVRPGPSPEGRGASVPDVAQPLAGIRGPQGDQLQTSDVTVPVPEEHPHISEGLPR